MYLLGNHANRDVLNLIARTECQAIIIKKLQGKKCTLDIHFFGLNEEQGSEEFEPFQITSF